MSDNDDHLLQVWICENGHKHLSGELIAGGDLPYLRCPDCDARVRPTEERDS